MSNKLLCRKLFSIALPLVAADYVNAANAQQTNVTKAEAALTAKIKCEDFRKNADGTWTSGPNTKIGSNAFSNHTFGTHGVSIGGADLATVLNRKCGASRPSPPAQSHHRDALDFDQNSRVGKVGHRDQGAARKFSVGKHFVPDFDESVAVSRIVD
jgi:hypothetical protein